MKGGRQRGGSLSLATDEAEPRPPPQAHLQGVHRSTTATRGPDGESWGPACGAPRPSHPQIASNILLAHPSDGASLNGVEAFGNDNNNSDKHSPFLKSLR